MLCCIILPTNLVFKQVLSATNTFHRSAFCQFDTVHFSQTQEFNTKFIKYNTSQKSIWYLTNEFQKDCFLHSFKRGITTSRVPKVNTKDRHYIYKINNSKREVSGLKRTVSTENRGFFFVPRCDIPLDSFKFKQDLEVFLKFFSGITM